MTVGLSGNSPGVLKVVIHHLPRCGRLRRMSVEKNDRLCDCSSLSNATLHELVGFRSPYTCLQLLCTVVRSSKVHFAIRTLE